MPILVWIPPNSTPQYKITVEVNGVEEDVTFLCSKISVEDYCTESIGKFSFDIYNGNNAYTNKWNGGEIFRYYKAYENNTTLYFKGRVEIPSKQTFKLNVQGRSESLGFITTLVTKSYEGVETSVILKDMISSYSSGFTSINVSSSTKLLTISWYQKPFWDCVKDLCNASGFDCWVDSSLDFHYYLSGSVNNVDDAIVHDNNLLEVEDFAPDATLIRNRIKVSGAVVDGIQPFYTAKDSASQELYGIKDEAINDDAITTYEQAKAVGDYELSVKKNPSLVGSVKCAYLLGNYHPGENLRVSAPSENLPFAYYLGVGYKDELDFESGNLNTTVYLNKEPRKISHVVSGRIEQENKFKSTYTNPNDLENSYDFLFDNEGGTFSSGMLQSNSTIYTNTSGAYWISLPRTLSGNISSAYLLMNASEYQNVVVQVSGNNGVSWQTIQNKELISVTNASGTVLLVKVTINSLTAVINSLSVQYNTS